MAGFERIGVVGAGMIGSEIALMFALSGRPTLLNDQSPDAAERAIDRLYGVLDRGSPRGFRSEEDTETDRRHLSVGESLEGCADRDLVIEAVFEDEALKREVFKRLDAILSPDAVLNAMTVIGKSPIRVKDVVGFAVNRLLHALVIESIRLVEEGVCTPADIDAACKLGLGHPIGPFELLDNTQNSLSLRVHEILHHAYGERFLPRPLLRQMVAAGYNGRKVGRGWRRYDRGGKRL